MAQEEAFLELWQLAQSGDLDAQADLYLEYGSRLRRIIALRLRDLKIAWAVEPDDVLHSFCIRLFNGNVKITIASALHFTNYCEHSLRNECHHILRSVIQRSAIPIEDCPPEVFEDPDMIISLERMAWAEELEAVYSRLTHRERVICWLALGGNTWEEIGERLNISPTAARKAKQRAETRMREEILASTVG